jgi:hypothetical protein
MYVHWWCCRLKLGVGWVWHSCIWLKHVVRRGRMVRTSDNRRDVGSNPGEGTAWENHAVFFLLFWNTCCHVFILIFFPSSETWEMWLPDSHYPTK